MTGIDEHMQILQAKIASYKHDDVYNMDEMGLFYNFASDTTIAMRWVRRAWASIDPAVFINCWQHTTILNMDVPTAQLATNELAGFEAHETNQVAALLTALRLENPMSLVNFFNPMEEDATD
jgi:hypothetical protein